MGKSGKRFKSAKTKVDSTAKFSVEQGVKLAVETATAKFDETIDVAIRLGIDPKQSDQQVRGAVPLPHGLGKSVRVLVFAKGPKEAEAKAAGADFVGADDLVEKINGGWLIWPYDVILIGGSVAEIPGSLKLQLADGGRLVAIVRDGPVGRGVVVERVGAAFGAVEQFDAVTPVLPGFEKRASFVF